MTKFKRRAAAGHILSTSWSLFYTYYISFQILGSQKSNALNSVQIEAKMKKLWPLEDNRAKLKGNFASCEITKVNLRNQGPIAKWIIQLVKFSQVMFQLVKSTCVIPNICD